MTLIWKTSVVREHERFPLREAFRRHEGAVMLLWHEEAFVAPYAYRNLGAYTLASRGTSGRLVTAVLEACGFRVFRGGSSRGGSRQSNFVMRDIVAHLKENRGGFYGLTADGSRGPRRVMKPGGLFIARCCGVPVYLLQTRMKRRWHFRTWDRMVFPLPFNRIETVALGPYWLSPSADEESFGAFHRHLQAEAEALSASMDVFSGCACGPAASVAGLRDSGEEGTTYAGRAFGQLDLQTQLRPDWEFRGGNSVDDSGKEDGAGNSFLTRRNLGLLLLLVLGPIYFCFQ